MFRRVFLTLLTAPVLFLASGQSQAVSYTTSQTSSTNYATVEAACMGTTDALNAAAGKVYTEFKFLSATKVDGAQVKYTCSLQGLYKWDSSWRDLKSTIFEGFSEKFETWQRAVLNRSLKFSKQSILSPGP